MCDDFFMKDLDFSFLRSQIFQIKSMIFFPQMGNALGECKTKYKIKNYENYYLQRYGLLPRITRGSLLQSASIFYTTLAITFLVLSGIYRVFDGKCFNLFVYFSAYKVPQQLLQVQNFPKAYCILIQDFQKFQQDLSRFHGLCVQLLYLYTKYTSSTFTNVIEKV